MLRPSINSNFVKIFNYSLACAIKIHSAPNRLVKEKVETVENKNCSSINDMLDKYNKEKEAQILKILNNYDLHELLGYQISKGRASKLLAWRMRNGLLKNLKDIFCIEGFGVKVADKFFQSLLLEPKKNQLNPSKTRARTAPFIVPSLEAEQRQAIRSTVSVNIGVNSVTWARLEVPVLDFSAPCSLTHWQHHEISDKRLHINDLINRCLYIHHLIPIADCYIFENPQIAQASNNPGSVELQNINVQKAQVIAIMGYALASRTTQFNDVTEREPDKFKYFNNVFYIRRLLPARLYNYLVGTERVSSEQTILSMMRTYYNTTEAHEFLDPKQVSNSYEDLSLNDKNFTPSSRVQFSPEFRQMFSKSPRYYREFLGQTLLLNLTFVRLILMQDSESIDKVSRGNTAKKLPHDEI